jgi:hypothetical protein
VRFCPYCLTPVSGRAVYCCPEHRDRARKQRQAAAARLSWAQRKIRARIGERARNRSAWRDIAMGRGESESQIAMIFDQSTRKKRAKRIRQGAATLTRVK